MEILATTIQYGGRTANMGNVADVTERKKTEQAVQTRASRPGNTRSKERTAELSKINEVLSTEITERRNAEEKLRQGQRGSGTGKPCQERVSRQHEP